MPEKKTFFISRAGPDKRWAELIASVVRDAGHEPFFQDEHFQVGQSIPDNMTRGAEADCTIAVFSPDYFKSEYCLAELNAALMNDPLGRQGYLIPVRIAPVELPSLVAQLAYLDLVGTTDGTARQRLTATLLKHGQFDRTKLDLVGRTRRAVEEASRNRTAMIEKVRTIWITGILQQSLFHKVRILLGLSERADAVARPMDLLVKRPDEGERPLPHGTEIVDVFDSMDRSLLILGEPGSGKTTLLLELARDLMSRAANDPTHPIPVIFPLSTWAETRKPLVEWLQDELNLRYDVPRKIAKEWVESDQILPLLDGLDEVQSERRRVCVEAINAFRQAHGFLPIAITSRTADYEALAEPLRLHGAILVRPLTREQVNIYLADLGSAGEPVRAAICEDLSLWESLDSPLMLNVVTVSYAGRQTTSVSTPGTADEHRDQVFGAYVSQMLSRRIARARYRREQTVRWLNWLADELGSHGQTVFYLEQLQRDCLPKKQRWVVQICTLMMSVLVTGLIFGSVFGLFTWLFRGLVAWRQYGLVEVLARGLIGGLVYGGLFGLVTGLFLLSKAVLCVETVRWSWSHCWHSNKAIILKVLLIVWFVVGLVWGLDAWLTGGGLLYGLSIGLIGGLPYGLYCGLSTWLFSGLTFSLIGARIAPNEGIHRSARNALRVGLLVGVAFGVPVALTVASSDRLPGGLGDSLAESLLAGLCAGLPVGLIAGLVAGGEACLKHFTFRLWLICNGSTPWNYVKFLDYAADRILLRKVGGGYMFIHRMLLEWFAKQYVEPGARTEMASKAIDAE